MKLLIVRPKYGLCNQLLSISRGIICAIISKRDIYFHNFQIDYRDENNLCDFNDIIDTDHLKKMISDLNITLQLDFDISLSKKIIVEPYTQTSIIKDFIPYLLNASNTNKLYLDIDNPLSMNIPREYLLLTNYINNNIKFTDNFINSAKNIRYDLKLNNYICLHLRLEDDSLNFIFENKKYDMTFEYMNNIYKQKYIEEIEKIKNLNHPIYICTSLITEKNINNDFYTHIKNKYNLLDKHDIKNHYFDKNIREMNAIIDFLIAKDSDYFIGSDWSSFSNFLYENHKNYKKNTYLIDIWQTLCKPI